MRKDQGPNPYAEVFKMQKIASGMSGVNENQQDSMQKSESEKQHMVRKGKGLSTQAEISKIQKLVSGVSGVLYDLDGAVNDLDSKQDLLDRSESEKRLNLLCGFLSLCLLICATAFMLICFRIYAPPTIKYYENKITNKTYSSGKPNLAILLPGGYMTSYSWNTSSNSSYPKLPKAYSYGMACFDQKLYAFGIPTYNGITVIHPNGTHRLIGTRGLNPFQTLQHHEAINGQAWFNHMIVFDKYLWLLGLVYNQGFLHRDSGSKTLMYSFIKNQWLTGPALPKSMSMEFGCTVGLNRSLSLLIGGNFEDRSLKSLTNKLVIAFDFSTQNWVWNYKMVPYPDTENIHYHSCSIVHGKLNSVVTVLVAHGSPNGYSKKMKADLWDFDFIANTWIYKLTLQSIEGRGKLAVVQGILHYFPFLNYGQKTLGYYFDPLNNTFHPVNDQPISFDYGTYDVKTTLYPVPCYLNSLKN